MTNGRCPSTILLAITDKMSMTSEIVVCNLRYSLIDLWGNDKIVQKAVPKISCPVSAQWKSSFQNKLYPRQTCQCITLKILWWRDKPQSLQTKWVRKDKSHPYWFLWYQIQNRKKSTQVASAIQLKILSRMHWSNFHLGFAHSWQYLVPEQ